LHITNNNHTSYTTQHKEKKTKILRNNISSPTKIIMPKVATKRKGKSGEKAPSPPRRRCIPRETVAAELPVATLVVTPEAALHARVSTPSSIESSPPTCRHSCRPNLQILQMHSTPSLPRVSRRLDRLSSRRRRSISSFAIALRSRVNV